MHETPSLQQRLKVESDLQQKAAWISLLVSFIVLSLKLYAYHKTHSAAVLSDALETVVNVITALTALFVIRIVAQPADEDHPYGHGKLEYFSAAFEGGLIVFAAVMVIAQGLMALFRQEPLHQLQEGLILIIIASIFNLVLGLYLRKVAKKHRSATLAASSAHILSDVVTTGGILVGLAVVAATGWNWLDPILAIGVAMHLLREGLKIVKSSIGGLIDEVDLESLENLAQSMEKNRRTGVINIHNLRSIRSGRFHHVDAHLVVPENWDILEAHQLADSFEKDVVRDYHFDGEIAFHMDPCQRKYCRQCDLATCTIRKETFSGHVQFDVKMLTGGPITL